MHSLVAGVFTHVNEGQEPGEEVVSSKHIWMMRASCDSPQSSIAVVGTEKSFQLCVQVSSNCEFHSSCWGFCCVDPDGS